MQKTDANEVRFVKYYSKYQNGNKVVAISILSPSNSKRVNSFAGIWKRCSKASYELPSIADQGWDQKRTYDGLKSSSQKI